MLLASRSSDTEAVRPAAATARRGAGGAGRWRSRLLSTAGAWLFLAPAIVFMLFYFGYPAVDNLLMGFQEYTLQTFYTGAAPWVGLDNYVTVVSDPLFPRLVFNTAVFTIGSIIGQFAIGMALAVFFQKTFPLNRFVRSLLLLPWLLPIVVSSAVWRWILDKDHGVLNQVLGIFGVPPVPWLTDTTMALVAVILVNIWIGIPFNLAILYGGLQSIPEELYEAASLDGATGWKAFWNVTWPLLRPVVNVVLILGVVYTIKSLDIILALTKGGPANATETIATQSYALSFEKFLFGEGAALANILIVVSLVFAMFYLRANRRALKS